MPWTVAHQAPLCMGFSRQEHWRGLQFPSPRDLSKPGIELVSPTLAGGFFNTCATWETLFKVKSYPSGDFPGGPVAKTEFPVQGDWVQSLVRELDSTCHN